MKKRKYATGQAPVNSTKLFELSNKSSKTVVKIVKSNEAKASSALRLKHTFSSIKANRYPEYEPPLVINVIDLDFQDDSIDYERYPDVEFDDHGGRDD